MAHGPTVSVSALYDGTTNVMATTWACVLDYGQTSKVTIVLDRATRTRELVENSRMFALQFPTKAMVTLTVGVKTFNAPGSEVLRICCNKATNCFVQCTF